MGAAVFVLPLIAGVLTVLLLSLDQLRAGRVEALAGILWALFTLYVGVRQLLFGRASVGADGLAIDRGKNLPRFVPWSLVEEVTIEHNHLGGVFEPNPDDPPRRLDLVCLRLSDGRSVRIARVVDPARLHASIVEALEAYRARDELNVPEALTEDVQDQAGYREAAIPTPLLVRVAEDPVVDPEVRVRAAKRAASAGGKGAMKEAVEVMADREMRKRLKEAIR